MSRLQLIEDIPQEVEDDINAPSPLKRLLLALDFGTTFSAMAYTILDEGVNPENIDALEVFTIENWPDNKHVDHASPMQCQVPSEVMYPPGGEFRKKFRQEFLETRTDGFGQASKGASPLSDDELLDDDDDVVNDSGNDSGNDNAPVFDFAEFFAWGYSVHDAQSRPYTHSNRENKALGRFKLLFDKSPITERVRCELAPTLESLRDRKSIRSHVDIVSDYLACLLRHAKNELRRLNLYDDRAIEMVLCVPAIWTQKACRDMQIALGSAMRTANFKGVDIETKSVEDLFLVSEPEAAAAYVLGLDQTIKIHDTFVLLDAGGGTVDANTYTVSRTTPLRLGAEVVPPGGGLCGSSYLNEGFRELLRNKLKDEKYLEQGQVTINGIVENILFDQFEYKSKRKFDFCDELQRPQRFYCHGLRDDHAKGFRAGEVIVKFAEMRAIFLECLQPIAAIMQQQIDGAFAKGVPVNNVVLIGGFSGSPALDGALRRRLKYISRKYGHNIELLNRGNRVTAVASGAVLRALDKQGGPQRFARSSYGILRREEHGTFEEHPVVKKKKVDAVDGIAWVRTIDWILKKRISDPIPSVRSVAHFVCSHTIPIKERRLLCEEVLYVSDSERAPESHYAVGSKMNEGAEKVGRIIVDFTCLRDEGRISPIYNLDIRGDNRDKKIGCAHYRIDYTMIIVVVDRDLRCWAVYHGDVVKRCRINIAAAFYPGAK